MLTSGISAEYGRFTGGVLNVITKSGGNDFSGSLPRRLRPSPSGATRRRSRTTAASSARATSTRSTPPPSAARSSATACGSSSPGRDPESTTRATLPVTGINVPHVEDKTRYEGKLTANVTDAAHPPGLVHRQSDRSQTQRDPGRRRSSWRRRPRLASARTAATWSATPARSPTACSARLRYSREEVHASSASAAPSRDICSSPIRSAASASPARAGGHLQRPLLRRHRPRGPQQRAALRRAVVLPVRPSRWAATTSSSAPSDFTVTRTGGNSQTLDRLRLLHRLQASPAAQPVLDSNGDLIPVFTSAAGRRPSTHASALGPDHGAPSSTSPPTRSSSTTAGS